MTDCVSNIEWMSGRIAKLEEQLAELRPETESVREQGDPQAHLDDSRTGLLARLKEAEKRIAELEQDGKRLDLLITLASNSNSVTIVVLDFGERQTSLTVRYQVGKHSTTPKLIEGKDLRQAIDKAMVEAREGE